MDAAYGPKQVLHGIDLHLAEGECLALVGESGSGKTTLARCIAGLHGGSNGPIRYRGRSLPQGVRLRDRADLRAIQYVFQNPYASLNPRRSVGDSIARPLHLFFDLQAAEIARRVASALTLVALDPAMATRFPAQLSGGERQRVAVARALAAGPDLLVCDEVTSALDVSVQAAVMELLVGLRQSSRLAMLFVTHNLPLVRVVADRVAVMQNGRIVESGTTPDIFDAPQHDYTRALLANVAPFAQVTG